eukprot:CAMPEP_0179100804 /NCGR_PEP_ID=MMETSP0796-20121207/46575_1 /TAXON_ID=73915 /ORGANISM="Pyrodinium bahamense, Strain pbaha01" /LENGTH=585 /DNA_ID=CAMNT_0020798639 /DNA_START=1 /DNA_END=1758 /DNA_ORIENTATION=+
MAEVTLRPAAKGPHSAEVRLKRAMQGPQKPAPDHIAMLEDLYEAAEAANGGRGLLAQALQLIAKLRGELEARVAALHPEVDQGTRHPPQKIWAALRALGLEPEEVSHPEDGTGIKVNSSIPEPARAERVKQQRVEVWEGLRQSRLEELRNTLTGLGPEDIRRYARTGDGIRAVRETDLPSVDSLAGMDDFQSMQEQTKAKLKAEQQRKADTLVTSFLQEKRRMEEADARIAAFEKRMADKKKEQEAERKAKRNEAAKKEEKRQQQVERCAQERREYEDETEVKIDEKLERAAKARAQALTRGAFRDKLAAADEKRRDAFRKAVQLEENMLEGIRLRQEALEVRLEDRRLRIEEEQRMRAEASQERFHERQMKIYAEEEEKADRMLDNHRKFLDRQQKFRDNHKAALQARSKSTGDSIRKAQDKWRSNYDKEKQRMRESHAALREKHQAGIDRVENELKPLRLKCDNDVFTFQEVKYGTWGELQHRRQQELTKSREAHTQALVFQIAEFDKKTKFQHDSNDEMRRRRQQMAKEVLTLNDRAKEGFLKIQCEPDERKIHTVLTNLGFTMPSLPDDEEEGGDGEKKAF